MTDIENFKATNDFTTLFVSKYKAYKSGVPYHINVIDLLRANENAHSRILLHLLNQNINGRYEILENFIDILLPEFEHKIEKPKFSSERYRIDLLITEKNKYAIIFENKIHNAILQKNQLARYIDKVKLLEFSEKQIYVVYLPPHNNNHPTDCSWNVEGKCCKNCDRKIRPVGCEDLISYRNSFHERYYHLTFRDHILPWLKKDISPNCRIKDTFLNSSIAQYIDHLEGKFDLRENNKKMNMELQEYIKKDLQFNESPDKNISILNGKIKDVNRVVNQLDILKDNTQKACWEYWLNRLKAEFPQYIIIDDYIDAEDYIKVGLILNYKEYSFAVLIETDGDSIYYGFGRHKSSESIIGEISTLVQPVLENNGITTKTGWWYGLKDTSYENGYFRLKSLISEAEKLVKNSL